MQYRNHLYKKYLTFKLEFSFNGENSISNFLRSQTVVHTFAKRTYYRNFAKSKYLEVVCLWSDGGCRLFKDTEYCDVLLESFSKIKINRF